MSVLKNKNRHKKYRAIPSSQRKIIVAGFYLLFIFSVFSPSLQAMCDDALCHTFFVDIQNTEGPWEGSYYHPFQKIQDAINASITHDSIFIRAGTYYEHLTIDKTILLYSVYAVVDGGTTGIVVNITADDVYVSRVIIRGGEIGIKIQAFYTEISESHIESSTGPGIYLDHFTSQNKITGNTIENNAGYGIHGYGIYENLIYGNTISNNGNDDDTLIHGIYLSHSQATVINRNTIEENHGTGIYLSNSHHDDVYDNTITSNENAGIEITDYSEVLISHNTISQNGVDGIIINDNSAQCRIIENEISDQPIGIDASWTDTDCMIDGNLITGHTTAGIVLKEFYGTIQGNTISQNYDGISMSGSDGSYAIIKNTVTGNTRLGFNAKLNAGGGLVSCNAIEDNVGGNAYAVQGTTAWDNGDVAGGNYWDDFQQNVGYPDYYAIPGGDDRDNHPLIDYNAGLKPLELSVPEMVTEETTFEVQVTSNGLPVENAFVDFIGDEYYTNSDGVVTLTAPPVQQMLKKWIYVTKDTYESNDSLFWVRDDYQPPAPIQFSIDSPPSIVGGSQFQITVTNAGEPMQHLHVLFNEIVYLTDLEGKTILSAPVVSANTNMLIEAGPEGYPDYYGSLWILVLVHGGSTPDLYHLRLVTPATVVEKEQFSVTVKNQETDIVVEDAQVTFNGDTKTTKSEGKVTFSAPSVTQDQSFSIVAQHSGFNPVTATVTILNIVENENTTIQLVSPNGNESIQDNYEIEWSIAPSGSYHNYSITLQYQYSYGLWITIVDHHINISDPYEWNTTTIDDGYPYLVKVILKKDDDLDGIFEQIISQDISDVPFAIDNSLSHLGWIRGRVTTPVGNQSMPIEDVTVFVVLSNVNNVITSKCTITNSSGEYLLPVRAGVYTIIAMRTGFNTTSLSNVSVWVNETTQKDIIIEPGVAETNLFLFTKHRGEINEAIKKQLVGGEISFIQKEHTTSYDNYVFIYDSITLEPLQVTPDQITVKVSGKDITYGGNTLILNIDKNIFSIDKELLITYDGEPIKFADNISDILDPNDDGSVAECLITKGAQGWQLEISVPHYSEHIIVITAGMSKDFGMIVSLVLYSIIIAVFAVVTAIPILRLWKKIE